MFWNKKKKSTPITKATPEPTLKQAIGDLKEALIGLQEYNGAATMCELIELITSCEAFDVDPEPYINEIWYLIGKHIQESKVDLSPSPNSLKEWFEQPKE